MGGSGVKVRLVVNNQLSAETVSNIIAVIRGEVEPDRYVIVGNHRDAWASGTIRPYTGTAAMVRVAEAFSEVRLGCYC